MNEKHSVKAAVISFFLFTLLFLLFRVQAAAVPISRTATCLCFYYSPFHFFRLGFFTKFCGGISVNHGFRAADAHHGGG